MGNLLIYSAAANSCIWQQVLPRCRPSRGSQSKVGTLKSFVLCVSRTRAALYRSPGPVEFRYRRWQGYALHVTYPTCRDEAVAGPRRPTLGAS
jgi:hypothetical protein